jgi:tetratricopeptide (TPR) repeat protein
MARTLRVLPLASLLLLLVRGGLAADKPWTEIRSPHFRVLTNGSTQDALKVAHEFEELRWVFVTRFPGARLESGASFLVLAARDYGTAKSLDPQLRRGGENVAGLFYHGQEKQYAMVRLDTFGGNGAKEVVYHEYAHTILHMNSRWLPVWLDEGTAEFYAYTRFDRDRIYLGAPTMRVRVLHSSSPNSIEEIMAVNRLSPLYSSEFFYAESWALVHFLIYGPGMGGGKKLDRFFDLLQQGTEQKKAFRDAFGEPKDIDKAFADYTWLGSVTRGDGTVGQSFASTMLKNNPKIDDKEFAIRTTSVAETEAELGGFHLWIHDLAGARALLEQSFRDDPKLGLAHENMGFLDFADGKDTEAASEFSRAYAFDGRLYLSLFAKTMLSPLSSSSSASDVNAVGAALGRVLQLKPQFAPAYAQLARLAVRENDLNSAILLSRKAEEMEPSLAGYHLLSGQVLLRMGKGSDAADAGKFVADRWIGSDHNEATELWNNVPAGQRPAGQVISVVAPKNTLTIEGKINSVVCGDTEQDWTFVIGLSSQQLIFHRKGAFGLGFSDTIWYGSDHFNLCHHLEGLRAVVHYRPPSDTTYAGDVAEIEIRDDLPAVFTGATLPSKP